MNTTTNLKRVNGKEITKVKRQKYLQKQERKLEQERKVESQRNWILRHGNVCRFIEKKDVKKFQQWYGSARGNNIGIHNKGVDGCHDIVESDSKAGESNEKIPDSSVGNKNTSNDATNHDRKRPRTSNHDTDSCIGDPCVDIVSNEQSQRNNQEQLWGLLSAYHELQNTNNQHSHDRVNGNKKRKYNMKSANSGTNSNEEKRCFIAEGSETIRVMIQNCSSRDSHSSKTTESKSPPTAHYDIGDASSIQSNPSPIHIISILVKPSIFLSSQQIY